MLAAAHPVPHSSSSAFDFLLRRLREDFFDPFLDLREALRFERRLLAFLFLPPAAFLLERRLRLAFFDVRLLALAIVSENCRPNNQKKMGGRWRRVNG